MAIIGGIPHFQTYPYHMRCHPTQNRATLLTTVEAQKEMLLVVKSLETMTGLPWAIRGWGSPWPTQTARTHGCVWKWLVPHCTQSGFADHYPVLKNGYFIGNINPTFSLTNPHGPVAGSWKKDPQSIPSSRQLSGCRQGRAKTFGALIRLRDALLMTEVPCHSCGV